ncbi:response regulator [Candidatus Oleimmundimicrobium sp.]|uniref:response regulator n=1 Tax=Candidatus Oleimmundimicrobium sp. TaxID=3060597 RepID=UPI002721C35E|nr:response regulator [Candidatus Oleimmundimicrobium sp.]MDO8885893.1 response regulator [Candidatus Oleimmundimicrobium sp.]
MEKEKILVVDDEVDIVKLITLKLANKGFKVIGAGDGEEALKKVAEEKPDLIILDISMPKMDGWEVCQKLKANPESKDIPIIMLTALGYIAEEFKGLQLGAVKYLKKPFDADTLIKAVYQVLEESKH